MSNTLSCTTDSIFTHRYWRQAANELKKPKMMIFAALMIAACLALSNIPSIRIGANGPRVTWGFLARSVCGMVTGPVTSLVFAVAEDTISFFLNSKGDPYFPGYVLTTMIGTMIYALCLYRRRLTVARIFLAKLLTNVLNVVLGSLWSAILYDQGYLYYAAKSLVKNVVMLPVQTLALCVLLAALAPIMSKMGIIPQKGEDVKLKLI